GIQGGRELGGALEQAAHPLGQLVRHNASLPHIIILAECLNVKAIYMNLKIPWQRPSGLTSSTTWIVFGPSGRRSALSSTPLRSRSSPASDAPWRSLMPASTPSWPSSVSP